MLRLSECKSKTVTELVESLCEPSAKSSLLELSRSEAKDIKVPSFELCRQLRLSECKSKVYFDYAEREQHERS